MIPLQAYLVVSTLLFVLGLLGVLMHRKNVVLLLMCLELMLLAVNTNFVAFSRFLDQASGDVFVFFVLAVAAAEAGVGLALLVVLYRRRGSVERAVWERLKS